MKITRASLILCSCDRNFVTLRIDTGESIYGLGDATLNGRELAVAAYLSEDVLPCLIERDPFHRAADLSPVTMAGALHFGLAIHNFGIQEHVPEQHVDGPGLPPVLPSRPATCILERLPASAWRCMRTPLPGIFTNAPTSPSLVCRMKH